MPVPFAIDTCSVYQKCIYGNHGHIRYSTPELFARRSCRAFRLVGDSTRFLYVTFSRDMSVGQVAKVLQDFVDNGVSVDPECPSYKFLGFSESNLKTGQVIFFCEGSDWSCDRLLRAFGDLEKVYLEYGPGAYAARLGLSFSSTIDTIVIPPDDEALALMDWEASDGNSLHTDGCGIIRETQAAIVRQRLGIKANTSVFQVRYGGVKGIVVAYPDADFDVICSDIRNKMRQPVGDMRPYKIAYRYSMQKYDLGPASLEVHACSHPPRSASLNFAFVLLLLSLGIAVDTFKDLLADHMKTIDAILSDRDTALRCLSGELDAQGEAFMQDVYEMLLAGFDLDEPQLRTKLMTYRKTVFKNLRRKLNIKVKKSCYLYGVVDELGVLGEDEVYINLPEREGVCVSNVLVARAPSYFPSDIRVFKAVDKRRLSFLTNCIVFSRTSYHSMPNSMSGGDLDGDMYFVSWDQTLIPKKTEELRLRTSPKPEILPQPPRDISMLRSNLIATFLKLRHLTLIGTIANEWIKAVEQTPELANAAYPQLLAKEVEVALDLLKSGIDSDALRRKFNEMKKANAGKFTGVLPTTSPLEILRRLIPDISDAPERPTEYEADPDVVLQIEGGADFASEVAEGRKLMFKFNDELRDAILMDEAGQDFDSNGDAILRTSSAAHLESYADKLKGQYISKYFPGGNLVDGVTRRSFIRASAWYHAGYEARKPAFAWLGCRYLCQLKAAATNQDRPGLAVGALKANN